MNLDAVFSALSDPTRRAILERLARGPLTAGQIAAQFSISQPGVSKHLRVLESSGLLRREIEGRYHRCTLAPKAMAAASAWIDRQREFWNAALDRLDDVLAESTQQRSKK